eukprot:Gb_00123 [translate_table: standard]
MAPKAQTVKDLVEEAKKRIVLLFICVIGLAYLMSLTSSSVWINIPAAVLVIVLLCCISHDLDARRRIAGHGKGTVVNHLPQNQIPHNNTTSQLPSEPTDWRRKVDSPAVEAAIDQLTKHLVAEWITDLWYKLITPDQDAPEELMKIMNGVIGEICMRAKDVNLIDLLTRDIVHLVCDHLELYRIVQTQIGEGVLSSLSNDERDIKLKLTLESEKRLHPALFSAEAERKVLQRFMDGVVSFTFTHEDLQCKFFRYTVRELLACAVMRPIMNLACPKFINERIESVALSLANKGDKMTKASGSETRQNNSSRSRSATDHFSGFLDRSISGVELVQLRPTHRRETPSVEIDGKESGASSMFMKELKHTYPEVSASVQPANEIVQHSKAEGGKTKLVTADNSKSQSENAEGTETINDGKTRQAQRSSGGEWAQMLDLISKRKSQALAPEHFENMWTKGRNYNRKDNTNDLSKLANNRLLTEASVKTDFRGKPFSGQQEYSGTIKACITESHPVFSEQIKPSVKDGPDIAIGDASKMKQPLLGLREHSNDEKPSLQHTEVVEESESSHTSEDDENTSVTGLGTPGIKVWDSRNRSGSASHVHHPLESSEGHQTRHGNKNHLRYRRLYKTSSARKRARSNNHGVDSWQELERTSFYLGDGQDILNTAQEEVVNTDNSGGNYEVENPSRVYSGTMASSSAAATYISGTVNSSSRNPESSQISATLLSKQLRCKVLGANFVKSGSKTIAVYSISVTDNENHTWSIKRRFRHFEELHRRLKDFPEYSLSLPPKRFLSSSLDASFVYERCRLLDKYLKDLLSLPNVAESIEVWDFLSVDSQTYMFFHSLSIIETLSVNLDDKQSGKHAKCPENFMENKNEVLERTQGKVGIRFTESASNLATSTVSDESEWQVRDNEQERSVNKKKKHEGMHISNSGSDSDIEQHGDTLHLKTSEKNRNNTWTEVSVPKDAPDIFHGTEDDSTVPSEWTPPNLSVPILNLVDVIFQLQDGGWIRRQAFWVAKQVLQLGMGDAFDDWLIEKIQLLRNGEVIASAIRRIEKVLWPDGIFITKHPRRRRPSASSKTDLSAMQNRGTVTSPKGAGFEQHEGKYDQYLCDQRMEQSRRAKFVRELMIDNAPAALVGLVGRKEYERCAQDIYFFLQSAVCVKQLAYSLLELLILAAFPELHDIVNSCHTEKESFRVIHQTK